jgi:hypothetical protein
VTITLDDQIQSLLAGAPHDGQTPLLMEIITPLLKELALQLKHTEYYILQSAEGRWMMTSLSHREEREPDKTVIYAYATLEDAQRNPHACADNNVMAIPTPVILILFQLLALQPVTSLLFFDTPGNRKDALEIRRDDIQNLVKAQLKLYQQSQANPAPSIPPDLA